MFLPAAAVSSWLAGSLLASSHSDLADWGQLLIGLAAVLSVIVAIQNNRGIKDAKAKAATAADLAVVSADNAKHAASNSATAVRTLGPENGKTLRDILEEIAGFEAYQHSRNHDILAGISQLTLAIPTLTTLAELLLARLEEELSDTPKETP